MSYVLPAGYLSAEQVAIQLGIGARTLRRHAVAGALKGFKAGNVWLFRASDVARFAAIPRVPGRPRTQQKRRGA